MLSFLPACVLRFRSLARYPLLQPPIPASAPQQTAPMLQASKSSSSGNLNAKKTKKSWSERLKEKFFGMHRGTSLRSSCERRRAPHHDTARRSRACVCVRACSLLLANAAVTRCPLSLAQAPTRRKSSSRRTIRSSARRSTSSTRSTSTLPRTLALAYVSYPMPRSPPCALVPASLPSTRPSIDHSVCRRTLLRDCAGPAARMGGSSRHRCHFQGGGARQA